jgi:4-oxalocrotonate tautomerase
MPIANVMILEGRSPQVKQALIRALTGAIVDTLKVKPESVRVIVQEVPAELWGIGGVSAKDLGK